MTDGEMIATINRAAELTTASATAMAASWMVFTCHTTEKGKRIHKPWNAGEIPTCLLNEDGSVDPDATICEGITHTGDNMTPLVRMMQAAPGQLRAARYDGDSAPSTPREPTCTCGHTMKVHRPGMCAGSHCVCTHYEPDTVRPMHSDPTGSAALIPDKAKEDRKALEADLKALLRLAQSIEARMKEHGPARPANDADRAALDRENIKPEPGCTNCGKHGHWQPIDPRRPNIGNCRWCNEYESATGVVPGKRECDLHADGKTVRRPDVNHLSRKASA